MVAFGAGHAIEDAAVSLKDAMPQEAVVLKGLLVTSLLLHDRQLLRMKVTVSTGFRPSVYRHLQAGIWHRVHMRARSCHF